MLAIARRSVTPLAPLMFATMIAFSGCGTDSSGGEISSAETDSSSSGGGEDAAIGDTSSSSSGADTSSSSSGADTSSSGTDTSSSSSGADASSGSADTEQDTASTDTADTTANPCPGGPGCDCSGNDDCDAGVCLDTHEGKKCAKKCINDCPGGYSCENIGSGGDTLFFCVSTQISVCAPCKDHKDCTVNGIDSLCLDYGAAGSFCGSTCQADNDCPTDYECIDTKDGNGKDAKQCKRKFTASGGSGKACTADTDCDTSGGEACAGAKCQTGSFAACECSAWAKSQGAETNCAVTNEHGTCTATRKCAATGLTACSAKTPAVEICNGIDDDCNEKTPDGSANKECSKKAYEDKGSKTDCKSDGDCATEGEACDASDGKCKILVGACKGVPLCVNGKEQCTGADTPTPESCNLKDDDCDGKIDEDFAWEDPVSGNKISVNEACGVGPCAGGTVKCETNLKAVCDSSGKAQAEKGNCDGIDDDCNGKTDDLACDDGDLCTTDKCDASNKSCSNDVSVDCDDKEQCTKDICNPKSGKCTNEDTDGASCDDTNACTKGDACGKHPMTGKISCLPGKPEVCDDANICTDDKCDTQKGCIKLPNAATETCYSGKAGTKDVGMCVAGVQSCKDGVLGGTCVGEVLPAAKEACDGKDDSCDGKTDEGCKPTDVAVTFSSAYVTGKSGTGDKAVQVQMMVGPSGPVGKATGTKHEVEFGFLAWLMALIK